jgi:demethoxyubiquinone hydroxylase (CLK1/Coq7/Cat5 family)
MDKTTSSLKVMQRMERLATNVYRYQIHGFKGAMADTLQKAYENEKEHAATLSETLRKHRSSPQAIGLFFAMAGGIAGLFTRIVSKRTLFSIDTYVEKKAVEDYTKFITAIKYNQETIALLNRIIEDEKRDRKSVV